MIHILFHSVLYLVEVRLSGEIHLLQKNECISNVIFVQFNFTHAPNVSHVMMTYANVKPYIIFMRSRYITTHIFYMLLHD